MRIETLAVHSGRSVDASTGAVTPPVHMSTTFQRSVDGTYPQGYVYSRSDNPTRGLLEDCMTQLEGGQAAAAFSSGMAAIMTVFQALSPGDGVIAPLDIYHGTSRLLREVMSRWDLRTTFVDMTDMDALRHKMNDSVKLVFIETPSNPLLKITDIAAVADLARQHGAYSMCDNTWATPVLQRPLDLGVDLVVHSSTKYLGGHGRRHRRSCRVCRQRGPVYQNSAGAAGRRRRPPLPSTAGCCYGAFERWPTGYELIRKMPPR